MRTAVGEMRLEDVALLPVDPPAVAPATATISSALVTMAATHREIRIVIPIPGTTHRGPEVT